MILGICDNPDVLKVMKIIVLLIDIVKVAVPIILILTLMIRLVSAMTKGKEDVLESVKKTAPANIVAAILIFLVPTLVNIVTKLTFPNSDYVKCISGASSGSIAETYEEKAEKLVSKAEEANKLTDYTNAKTYLVNVKNAEKKAEFERRLEEVKKKIDADKTTPSIPTIVSSDDITPGKFIIDPGKTSGCNKNGQYAWCSPKKGAFGSFPYYDTEPNSVTNRWSLKMDPKWAKENFVYIKKTCSNGWKLNFQMHRLAKSTWEKVQEKLCQITTTGIDGYKYEPSEITFSGDKASSVARFQTDSKIVSEHSYGTTIDINPGVSYKVNGKNYIPYNRNVNAYESFVKALGREDDPRNINYVLWKKIFQPLGFRWGGNWGRHGKGGKFDGMHFEIDWSQTK